MTTILIAACILFLGEWFIQKERESRINFSQIPEFQMNERVAVRYGEEVEPVNYVLDLGDSMDPKGLSVEEFQQLSDSTGTHVEVPEDGQKFEELYQ